jgi:outer membrane protein assembly factor BamB
MIQRSTVLAAGLVMTVGIASAADWPQFRGPERTGISKETGLLKSLPEGGPKLIWTFEQAGVGYSGPAIVGDRLYCGGADADADKEFAFCVDVKTGKELWRTSFPKLDDDTKLLTMWGGGPRGTPTVDGDALYLLGVKGDLVCFETSSGKIRWQKNMVKDFGGRVMQQWGWCESPLVDGDILICCPGYENGTVAALKKQTGDVIWRSTDLTEDASYSSPLVATIGGVKQYIVKTDKHTAGVSLDGKLLWQEALGVNKVATIPMPIVRGDSVFSPGSYRTQGGGTVGMFKLAKDGDKFNSTVVWRDLSPFNHHGGVVLIGDHIYGHSDGDKENPKSRWVCVEFDTGKEVWNSTNLEKGSVTAADGKLFCWGEKNDTVVMIDASPTGWTEHGRFTLPKKSPKKKPQGGYWTHPVVANGKLYLRDQDLIFCFDVSGDRAEN